MSAIISANLPTGRMGRKTALLIPLCGAACVIRRAKGAVALCISECLRSLNRGHEHAVGLVYRPDVAIDFSYAQRATGPA